MTGTGNLSKGHRTLHEIGDNSDGTRIEKILTSPLIVGLTTLLGVWAGYLGAHYDKAIFSSLFTIWKFNGPVFDGEATFFWLTAAVFGILFGLSSDAQAKRANRFSERLARISSAIDQKTDALRARAETIDDRVRQLFTIPPVGFLEEYRGAILSATESLFVMFEPSLLPVDTRDLAIRVQLSNILKLATEFDEDGHKARYACNIMLFRPSTKMTPTDVVRYEGMLRFADKATSVQKLHGVLELVPALSVASDSSAAGPDSKLAAFCLPVPLGASSDKESRFIEGVLPGAADAFVATEASVIETPDDWLERCNGGAFSGSVAKEMRAFFEEEKDSIQSFLSFPLFEPDLLEPADTARSTDLPFGVLNLHRNLPNKLAAEKLELLEPLLTPSLQYISYLLSLPVEAGAILETNGDPRDDQDT